MIFKCNIYIDGVIVSGKGGEAALRSNQEMVPLSEIKRLETEKQQLQRALGEMTLERNILRDTLEVVREKKWILDGR